MNHLAFKFIFFANNCFPIEQNCNFYNDTLDFCQQPHEIGKVNIIIHSLYLKNQGLKDNWLI